MSGRWAVPLAALLLLCACGRPPPEQRLRDTIAALQATVEARDPAGLRPVLAEDFIGPDGLDREGAVRLAQLTFLRHRAIGVHTGPLEVRMQGDYATVRFQAALTGGAGGALPDAARLYDVETGWRLDDGDWRLVSATWTPRL